MKMTKIPLLTRWFRDEISYRVRLNRVTAVYVLHILTNEDFFIVISDHNDLVLIVIILALEYFRFSCK
jgi:hypothetical protein